MAQEKKMKFKPRFIEAFRSGQKITSLRMMDFNCFPSIGDPDKFFHKEALLNDIQIPDYSAGSGMIFDEGTIFTRVSNFAELLKRQPYKPLSNIELVTTIEGGEIMPFAIAFIKSISVIKGNKLEAIDAIHDGFNPDRDPLSEFLAFMQDIYPDKILTNEMYWLYTFTNIQMLSGWEGDA